MVASTKVWNNPTLKEKVESIFTRSEGIFDFMNYVHVSYCTHDGKECSRKECEDFLLVSTLTDNTARIERLKELPGFLKLSTSMYEDEESDKRSIRVRAIFTREQRFHY